MSAYIYNGTEASVETFPSIATLYYDAIEYTGVYGMYCGATILDSEHILTAAHCLYDGSGNLNEEYMIYTSVAVQMENEADFLSGSVEVVRASEFYTHPEYIDASSSESGSWPNDIAIIKLASELNVDSSDFADIATSIDSDTYRNSGEEFIAVGHGYTESGDGEELLQTSLEYQSADECDLGDINESQLCMSGTENEETGVRNSTCSGDSGGPLYWHDGTGYLQAGITSYGWTGCFNADSDDTSVFTEVAYYSDWISSVMSGTETPDFSVTEAERDAYAGLETEEETVQEEETSSDSSGGATSKFHILLLTFLALLRIPFGACPSVASCRK